jgi:hypothetical protein
VQQMRGGAPYRFRFLRYAAPACCIMATAGIYLRVEVRMGVMSKRIALVALNIIGVIGTIIINAMGVLLPLNNKTTAELSDKYPNLFVPAGYTFSIWSVIYLLLIAFTVYHVFVLIKNKGRAKTVIEKTGILFFLSCCANAGWIFAWHYELVPLSMAVMLVLLAVLIMMYLRLNIGKEKVSPGERYCVHLTVSVYLGWISIATIANASVLLVSMGWNSFSLSDQIWTIMVIIVGITLGILTLFLRNDVYYTAVIIWAFTGILIKRLSDNPSTAIGVIIAVIVGIAMLCTSAVVQAVRRKI